MEIRDCLTESFVLDSEEIQKLKSIKRTLSKQEKRLLTSEMAKFKYQNENITKNAIILLAIWNQNEAIDIARKKGVFRYKAYGFKKNIAAYLLNELYAKKDILYFNKETLEYIESKRKLSWLFDFYKNTEDKIIKEIIKCGKSIKKINVGGTCIETALFKNLLAYIDVLFAIEKSEEESNKNTIKGYSKESKCEAISYIIYLYDKEIGISQDKLYFIDSKYVLSKEIEELILLACKSNLIQEWELHVDYLGYKVDCSENNILIYDKTDNIEKSIQLGNINRMMQENILENQVMEKYDKKESLTEYAKLTSEKLKSTIIKSAGEGILERYYFEYPAPIFDKILNQPGFFLEEISILNYLSKELMLTPEELLRKEITEHCTFKDIILFQRYFIFMSQFKYYSFFTKIKSKDKDKIIRALSPQISINNLANLFKNIIGSCEKVKELVSLFTYEKSIKLDLQYTPFIKCSNELTFANDIVSKSNLLRNSIAYSYLIKNQTVNKNCDLEPLVRICEYYFKIAGYEVLINRKYKYNSIDGEIDVIAYNDQDIILMECKAPLTPTSIFEMRSSINHIEKANEQLDHSKLAFEDDQFRKRFYKDNKIENKTRGIKTLIVFGSRVLTGYPNKIHPIRYIYELGSVLEKGIISGGPGSWSIWKNKNYSHQDLIDYISNEKTFINFSYDNMNVSNKEIFIKGKKIIFKSFAQNIIKTFETYDQNLKILEKDERNREIIRQSLNKQNETTIL